MSIRARFASLLGVSKSSDKFDAFVSRHPNVPAILQLLPALMWYLLLFGLSIAFIFVFSFLTEVPPQSADVSATLENYIFVLSQSVYRETIVYSLVVALITTVACLVLAYPPAYYLALIREKQQNLLLLLLILPFWINIVIRTFAWRLVFTENGVLHWVFVQQLGIFSNFNLLFTDTAVLIGLIHVFLPFMIIPIYGSLINIERSHIEAAKNLGANKAQAFYEITLPQSLPGIAAGVLFVYILSAGAFVTPLLLGGTEERMIANIIGDLFISIRAWERGSALAIVFSIIIILIIYLFNRMVGIDEIYGGES